MSMPRICAATASASSALPASFTPPALPRPPIRTWALMTTLPPGGPSARNRSAAARASATVWATAQAGTGRPWATSSDLASASWSFTRGRLRCGRAGKGTDGTPSRCLAVEAPEAVLPPVRAPGRWPRARWARPGSAATSERPGVASRAWVSRARPYSYAVAPRLAPPRNMTTSARVSSSIDDDRTDGTGVVGKLLDQLGARRSRRRSPIVGAVRRPRWRRRSGHMPTSTGRWCSCRSARAAPSWRRRLARSATAQDA